MIRTFKKPSGYTFRTDSKVHSNEYIAKCAAKFEEVKEAKKTTKKAPAKGKKEPEAAEPDII